MQLVVLILAAVVLLEDRLPVGVPDGPSASFWSGLAAATLLPAALLGLLWLAARRAQRSMDAGSGRSARDVDRVDRLARAVPWAGVVAAGAAVLGFDWLRAIRAAMGNWPVIDELSAMAPALVAMAAAWWLQEPIERRIHDAARVRHLDEGLPLGAWRSRPAFVLGRVRTGILLLLVPLLLVLALIESLEPLVSGEWPRFWASGGRELLTMVAAGGVFLVSPLLARVILQLEPLPPGELRSDLQAICDACGVRVRGILLWRTDHGMVNGAVMGLVAPIRFVMLTDGLIELLPRPELRAVMAHEIGHVRRRHLPWMLGMLVALLGVASFAVEWPASWVDQAIRTAAWTVERKIEALSWLERGAAIVAAAMSLLLFGWVSRRIERQADTFAVQFLSEEARSPAVTPDAVLAMSGALGSVARHAGVPRERRSWRHGAIAWRQRYLEGIVGMPVRGLPIDRLVGVLKWMTAALLLVGAILMALDATPVLEEGDAAGERAGVGSGYHAAADHRPGRG